MILGPVAAWFWVAQRFSAATKALILGRL